MADAQNTSDDSMRSLFRTAGFGAFATAVAVTVEDNPWFVAWLVAVGALSLLSSWLYDGLATVRLRRPVLFWSSSIFLALVLMVTCVYAVFNGRSRDTSSVDEEARRQAQAAQKQVSDMRTEMVGRAAEFSGQVAAVQAQLKAAMQFLEKEKTARDEEQQRQLADKTRRERIATALTGFKTQAADVVAKCKTVPRPEFLTAAEKVFTAAMGYLEAEGLKDDAQNLRTLMAPGMPRRAPPDCTPYVENTNLAYNMIVMQYVLDNTISRAGR
jgi:hypothetical protein